jgi:hypothetical protein
VIGGLSRQYSGVMHAPLIKRIDPFARRFFSSTLPAAK